MDPLRPHSLYPDSQSQRVVEVVDCLADTVVSVNHLEREQSTSRTRFYLMGALLCFLVMGGSFFSAVSTASSNKAALHAHLAAGKTAHSFRPARVAGSLEWVGGLALFAGLGLSFAFFATRKKAPSRLEAERPAGESEPSYELVSVSEHGAQVRVHPEMELSFTNAEGVLNDEDLCQRGMAFQGADGWVTMNLPDNGKLRVARGQRSYFLNWTPRANSRVLASETRLDSRFAAYLGASAVAALLFVTLLDSLPMESHSLYGDRFTPSERYIAINSTAMEDAIVEPETGTDGAQGDTAMAEASEAGAKGSAGIESATAARASMAIKQRQERQTMSKEQVRSWAAHQGALGVMRSQQLFANMNSIDTFASGDAVADWYGGFDGGPVGHQAGELSGSWGNDIEGLALWGTSKIGNRMPGLHYGPGGKCTDEMPCTGTPGVKIRSRVSKRPEPQLGPVTSSGGLDRAIIRRHIKKQKLRITHCYEKRLLVDDSLSGTLVTSFSIGSNGKVIGAKAKGMSDTDLQQCVAGVVASIQFPSTEGGGIVNVQYPFTFQPAGF